MADRPTIAHRVIMGSHLPLDEGLECYHRYDLGRSPRFPEGWWIAPAFVLGLAIHVAFVVWVLL